MISEIKKNVDSEIDIIREISYFTKKLKFSSGEEKRLLEGTLESLKQSMKILNESIPKLLTGISLNKKLPGSERREETRLENVRFKRDGSNVEVVLDRKDKEKFLRELSISDKFIQKLKKREKEEIEVYSEFKGSRGYLKLANKLFFNVSGRWIEKGRFKSLMIGLRKANIDVLFRSYVAMIFLTVSISFIFGIFLLIFLTFFEIETRIPFIGVYDSGYFLRFVKLIWIPIVIPFLTYFSVYYYPATERKNIGKKIDQELPFAVIHMSSVSGSGIEPSEIFKIIGMSREYPNLKKEIRKIMNQINLYGYDLVTSLNNAAKTSPSEKLSELFSGLSVTITSGSDISEFLEKRSESLLLSYRLEREKYTKLVETFLDIYISLVIAAPMIFLLLLVLMTYSGISIGFGSGQLSLMSIAGIALLNVFFLIFLQIKQPVY